MPRTRSGVTVMLAFILLIALAVLAQDDDPLFPQRWTAVFYAVKGLVAIVAVMAMVVHVSRTLPNLTSTAQQCRYLLLLGFVVVVGAASSAQYKEAAPVTGRNIAGFVLAALTIPVAIMSIRQDRPHR